MSGTSLDGVDLVYLSLVRETTWDFHIKVAQTVPYTDFWKQRLATAMQLDTERLHTLNVDYTDLLADIINSFLVANSINDILAVCSHGHTVYHDPVLGKTLQIGNLERLSRLIGLRLVCDFRTQDVHLGGQGAPLVPIGDELLFSEYAYCLNLGGFANVSFLKNGNRVAFDICPVNVVLNQIAALLGKEYDDNGAFAKAGNCNHLALNALNNLEFYKLPAPKSLGMEWVNRYVWAILDQVEHPQDKLATVVEHVAMQIAKAIATQGTVLITGGGAYNAFLIARLRFYSNAQFVLPKQEIIEFKEAVIFALLGVLRLRNEPNCLGSVTGAPMNHCSGKIYVP
jgi:anhydro-N-acetylmuramic acid kinase